MALGGVTFAVTEPSHCVDEEAVAVTEIPTTSMMEVTVQRSASVTVTVYCPGDKFVAVAVVCIGEVPHPILYCGTPGVIATEAELQVADVVIAKVDAVSVMLAVPEQPDPSVTVTE